MQRAEARFDFRQPLGQPLDLRGGFLRLAAGVNQTAIRFALFRAGLELDAARLLGAVTRCSQRRFSGRELLDRGLFSRARAIEIRRRLTHVLLQRLELGAALQRSRGRGTAVEEDRAIRAAQRARADHLVAGEQRANPGRRGTVHAELVLERVAVVPEPRPRDAGEEHQRARLSLRVPGADRLDDGRILDEDRMQPFAQQTLGQLGVAPAGADEISERPQNTRKPGFQQCLGGGRQTDVLAVELGERVPPCLELRQCSFRLAPGRSGAHLLFM